MSLTREQAMQLYSEISETKILIDQPDIVCNAIERAISAESEHNCEMFIIHKYDGVSQHALVERYNIASRRVSNMMKRFRKRIEKAIRLTEALGLNSIMHMELPPRAQRYLMHAGIETVDQLARYSQDELLQLEGLGTGSVQEIVKACKRINIALREPAVAPIKSKFIKLSFTPDELEQLKQDMNDNGETDLRLYIHDKLFNTSN